MARTKISWADEVWNPVVGCTGTCPYCYARKMAHRFHMGRPDFAPVWIEKNFQRKFRKATRRVFVNSMSDLADWDDEWYVKVWKKMTEHPAHLFLFLSKRPWKCSWSPLPNAMLGWSITRQADVYGSLGRSGDAHFLSIEPLLEHIKLPEKWHPHWLIVGAETGNRKGCVVPKLKWLRDIHDFARAHDIPLFFKESLRPIWPAGEGLPREWLK
jgi:protein gp37